MTRTFALEEARRERVPLLVGLSGPSGGGKTFTALTLAKGMQEVAGGEIVVIDTENRRSLHYADQFKFQHMGMGAPFGSLDYLSAIRQAAATEPACIIIDSMSHEHEGAGGMLDMHSKILTRMAGTDSAKMQRFQMLAWKDPKAARRALLNGLVQLNVNIIMCFRAAEKAKPGKDPKTGKTVIVSQGWTPIAGPEFVFESTISTLLRPGSQGVPTWHTDMPGEFAAIKRPGQFAKLFKDGEQVNSEHGRIMAEWARGGVEDRKIDKSLDIDALMLEGDEASLLGTSFLMGFWKRQTKQAQTLLATLKDEKWKDAAAAADAANAEPELETQS